MSATHVPAQRVTHVPGLFCYPSPRTVPKCCLTTACSRRRPGRIMRSAAAEAGALGGSVEGTKARERECQTETAP